MADLQPTVTRSTPIGATSVPLTGGSPQGWSKAKRRQKDPDARWTIKRRRAKRSDANEMQAAGVQVRAPMFGYKNQAGIDRRH